MTIKSSMTWMLLLLLGQAAWAQSAAAPQLKWDQQQDKALSLLQDGKVLWTFNYDRQEAKPCFYPLRSTSGVELACHRPPDHPWHYGLWFSWKLINGVNYWEEDKAHHSAGMTEITDAKVTTSDDFSAHGVLHIAYHPKGKPSLLDEVRTLKISRPQPDGSYSIDWDAAFTAGDEPLAFERTKPYGQEGSSHGGYAGLSVRCAASAFPRALLDSNGWHSAGNYAGYGQTAGWVDSCVAADADGKQWAGVAILAHPDNSRAPTPWYLSYQKEMSFFNAALLYHEPLKLAPQQKFHLAYRILVHEGRPDAARLQAQYERFSKAQP